MIVPGDPGVYIVGTGSSGAAQTFLFLGIVYFIIMTIAAFSYRVPPEGWKPKGWTPPKDSKKTRLITKNNVHIDQALKTPQFYFLWIVLCFNVTAGIGVIGVAKTMMIEIFEPSLPAIVTAGFAGTYVLMISIFLTWLEEYFGHPCQTLLEENPHTLYFFRLEYFYTCQFLLLLKL